MHLDKKSKESIKKEIIDCVSKNTEIKKVIIFGSFVTSENPNDIDIAIVEESDESYLPLSLKYRKQLRPLAKKIPIDVLPIKMGAIGSFLEEINRGETIYEKRD